MSHSTPHPKLQRFLKPEVLSRLGNLELIARTVVEGYVAGLHQSPFLGFSVDFAEYRQYMPGDDIRRIDWKVYARSDRFYVKEFEGETNTCIYLLLDVSASMAYASVLVSKIEYASYLVASLAYFGQRQKDSVGLLTFDERIVDKIPARCRAGHLSRIYHALDKAKPKAQTEFGRPLHSVAETLRKRGIVVLVSDLWAPTAEVIRGLHQLRHKGHDIVVFHVLDPQERSFAFTGQGRLQDMENQQTVPLIPEWTRGEYLRKMELHTRTLRQECGAMGIDYVQVVTEQPLDFMLYKYLATRRKSM